jgi:hypothetical protein
MATASTTPPLGWKARDFELEGTDGKRHRLGDLKGPKGTLVMFICNHCPYVQAVLDDIIADARELQAAGIASIAVMPNDTRISPGDSFDNMKRLAGRRNSPSPISSIRRKRSRGPMTPPARRISSASTPISGCNIAAASMRAATAGAPPEASASSTTPCSRSPAAAKARRTRHRVWAVPSNGGRNSSVSDREGPDFYPIVSPEKRESRATSEIHGPGFAFAGMTE